MPICQEVDNETMAGVKFCFAVVAEDELVQMQDNAIPMIPNKTKKATKLRMKVFKDKQRFNPQTSKGGPMDPR